MLRFCRGFKLPASHVIHTVGPIYDSDKDPKGSLRNAYKYAMMFLFHHSVCSLSLSFSIRFPLEIVAEIA